MKRLLYPFCVLMTAAMIYAGPFSEYAVTSVRSLAPDLDAFGHGVWQQWYAAGNDWDVYYKDLNGTAAAKLVADWNGNQTAPAVYGNWVVFEDEHAADDHDVFIKDITSAVDPNTLAATALDERAPAIYGNTVAWQRLFVDTGGASDWDVVMTDITQVAKSPVYSVASFEGDQSTPAVYRTTVLWQDNYFGDFDIYSADILLRNAPAEARVSATALPQEQAAMWKNIVVWDEDFGGGDFEVMAADVSDPKNPKIFTLSSGTAAQMNPDIYEHIVVWQDNRAGNWDIWGYNLITRKEFQITSDPADQTGPTIGGKFVAWVDKRTGTELIYAAVVEGTAAAAQCASKPAGDLNGDCVTNLADLLLLSEGWLSCGRIPVSACN